MKTPLIALIGRPNVGKSTLFNALTKKRQALVADFSGVTRDRRFGEAEPTNALGTLVRVVDTGGWMPKSYRDGDVLLEKIEEQIFLALEEAAIIVQVVDIRAGLTPLDQEIAQFLRKKNLPFVVAANKADVVDNEFQKHEFYSLGGQNVISVSAEHRLGIDQFWEDIYSFIEAGLTPVPKKSEEKNIKICIVGRPNVGKSSLLNLLSGRDRAVASPIPGTTTDPVDEEIIVGENTFTLIDTAGIRRPSKRENDVEDLGVMYAKRNLGNADLALFLLDSEEGFTSQDGTIGELIEEAGTSAIIIANKWDLAPKEILRAENACEKFAEKLWKLMPVLEFAPVLACSVVENKIYGAVCGVDAEDAGKYELPENFSQLWDLILDLIAAREQKIPMEEIQEYIDQRLFNAEHLVRETGELRKIHQVGNRPPQFLAYVKDANKASESLRRFLSRAVRERYGFRGNPIRWVFRHKAR